MLVFFGGVLFSQKVLWAADCPKGLVNDPAPGECGSYVDKNKDGFCDLSQELAQATKTPQIIKTPQVTSVLPQALPQALPQKEEEVLPPIQTEEVTEKQEPEEISPVEEPLQADSNPAPKKSRYYFWPITLITFLLYGLSWGLVRLGWLGLLANRRFWNVLLLFFFIPTAISSLALLGRLEFGWNLGGFNWIFWHVEFGYLMLLVSFFHLSWHGKYYRCIWGRKGKKTECLGEK